MGLEDSSRPAPDAEPKEAPAEAPAAPSDAAKAKERAEEAARGRLRRAKDKLKEAKDEASLKKIAAELAGVPPAGAVQKLAPVMTVEKMAEVLHGAIASNGPLLQLVADGSEEVWADACRSVAQALGDQRGKQLCEGWAPLLCALFPNGLDNPYAAAVISTIVFSVGVGVQTAMTRNQREEAKKGTISK